MKYNKILKIVSIMLLLVVCSNTFIYAVGSAPITSETIDSALNDLNNAQGSDKAITAVQNAWQTILLVLQILAVAAIVITGVRYMLASANEKADIKQQTIILIIGAVLVFGTSSIITLVTNITDEIL